MKVRLKALRDSIGAVGKTFPVEIGISVVYMVMAIVNTSNPGYNHSVLLPLALLLSLAVNNIARGRARWAYFATIVPPIVMFFVDVWHFISTPQYLFLYPLMALAYLLSRRKTDNKDFAVDAVEFACNVAIGAGMALIATMALSFMALLFGTLFGIRFDFEYLFDFAWLFVMPVTFLIMQGKERSELTMVTTILHIAINFIICPAILIYTAIFYVYGIIIAAAWELPDGGLAVLVLIYFIASIAGKMLLEMQSRHWYDWFFNRLHLVSLPLMVLYWVGLSYRINQYSFTESRAYLAVAGVVMMCVIAMMFVKRLNRYRLMLLCASLFIIIFTYIPGISAGDIGCRAQFNRFYAMAEQMKVLDNGKLSADALMSIKGNDDYKELLSIYLYLRKDMGREDEEALLGEWIQEDDIYFADHQNITYIDSNKDANGESGEKPEPKRPLQVQLKEYEIPLEGYRMMLDDSHVNVDNDGAVNVYDSNRNLLLSDTLNFDSLRQMDVEEQPVQWQDVTLRNDSVMVVFTRLRGYSDYYANDADAIVLKK